MQVVLSSEHVTEPPVEIGDIRTILVRDSYGNPIFLAIQQTEENIWAVTPDDPKFQSLVEQLGISKRLTIKRASIGGERCPQ